MKRTGATHPHKLLLRWVAETDFQITPAQAVKDQRPLAKPEGTRVDLVVQFGAMKLARRRVRQCTV